MRIVACLNGNRRPGEHPALPVSPDQIAEAARSAVAAGATEVHVHPRDGRGEQGMEPQVVAPLLDRLRTEIPEVPISVTTSLSAEPDPWRRFDLVGRWGTAPDSATVNPGEPGALEVARLLIDRRIPVEADLWTAEAARILAVSGLKFSRILVGPQETEAEAARGTAERIGAVLDRAGVGLPRTLYGREGAAWPLLDDAIAAGHGVRIGLQDTFERPDGTEAEDNADLVRLALARLPTTAQ